MLFWAEGSVVRLEGVKVQHSGWEPMSMTEAGCTIVESMKY